MTKATFNRVPANKRHDTNFPGLEFFGEPGNWYHYQGDAGRIKVIGDMNGVAVMMDPTTAPEEDVEYVPYQAGKMMEENLIKEGQRVLDFILNTPNFTLTDLKKIGYVNVL